MTQFERELLGLLSAMNDKIEKQGEQLEDIQRVLVSTADDVSTVRSRVIEQASRDGETIHRHQRSIQEIDARVRKLETA